jgi:hypothetical protein
MSYFCAFCSKLEDEEEPLIEVTTNLLYINKKHYEFQQVFADLFNLVSFVLA